MGIRYYAYPIDAEFIEMARTSAESFLSDDPLMDAWGPADEKPRMLYLDKCWRELQGLLGGHSCDGGRSCDGGSALIGGSHSDGDTSPKRPAFALVEGKVTDTAHGWIAYTAVLDPEQVAAIAEDLAAITPAEVRSFVTANASRFRESVERELDYVNHYLTAAVVFTKELSERGEGLAYLIG